MNTAILLFAVGVVLLLLSIAFGFFTKFNNNNNNINNNNNNNNENNNINDDSSSSSSSSSCSIPPAQVSLNVLRTGSTAIISWTVDSLVKVYILNWKLDSESVFTNQTILLPYTNQYIVTGLNPLSNYNFILIAQDKCDNLVKIGSLDSFISPSTATATLTNTGTATATLTNTGTATATLTNTGTATATLTNTGTATATLTNTGTGTSAHLGPNPVLFNSAGNYTMLSKSGITNVPTSNITGNLGVSPITSTAITGFALVADGSNTFWTSTQVTGRIYSADNLAPTPGLLTTAVSDMQAAYVDAAGRTSPTATELASGLIGGLTLAPGLYKWSTNVAINSNLTLAGGANDVWIFQIAGNLTLATSISIILSGGAQAKNIFWQVAGSTTLFPTSVFKGSILSLTAINMQNGASLTGNLYAQTGITLISNVVVGV
jgi:hypothetical protein